MSALEALIDNLESTPDCQTCAWLQALPKDEQELFARYIANSVSDQKKYSRTKLHEFVSEKMGYPLKLSAFKECVRRHHVPQ